ncbi:MAG: hypothetical protein U0269_10475 [Polyangiales bacterium]
MSAENHPTDEELFNGDRTAIEHAKSCDECRVRAVRLKTGAALVQRVRKTSQPELDWAKVDAMIAKAADQTAEDIRAGRIRKPAPVRPYAVVGGGLALAAGALLAWRLVSAPAPQQLAHGPSSNHGPSAQQPATTHTGGEAPLPAIAAWPEARVLLATNDVDHVSAAGERSPLTARSRVRSGDRLHGRSATSRALIAAAHGQRLDARGESELHIGAMQGGESAAELVRGEARVDVSPGSAKLSLDAHEWRVVAKRGTFVAKIEGDNVRVRVLSGVVDAAHRGGAPSSLAAGSEFVLDKNGQRVESPLAQTPDGAVDDRALGLSEDGELVELPALPEGAELTVEGVSVPRSARVFRVSRAVRAVARRGSDEWSIELDPRRAARDELHWTASSSTVASAQGPSNSEPHPAPHAPLNVRRAQPSRTVLTAATVPPQAQLGFRAVQRSLGQRARHCFDACERNNSCGDASGIAPIVDFDAEGRVGAVRLEGSPSPTLSACIDREVRALRLPLLANERVNLGRFSR